MEITLQLLFSVLALFVIVKLFFGKNIPLFLMAGIFMQWLSVAIKVIYSALTGVALKDVFSMYAAPQHMDEAFYLSMAGVIAYALGVKAGLPSWYKQWNLDLVKTELLKLNSMRVVQFYLFYSIAFGLAFGFRQVIPGLNTGIVALGLIKWGILVIAVLCTYYKKENGKMLALVLAVEIVLSLASFFSEFKEYIYVLLIIFVSLKKRYAATMYVVVSIAAILLFQIAIIWTTIKGEYRNFLSKGAQSQKVSVDKTLALEKFYDLATHYDRYQKNLAMATDYLVDRLGYINFFSKTISYVPEKRPHENGTIWYDAITYFFMPRLFFPHKPVLDDSGHLNKYTGLGVAGIKQGTSFSLGYMAESYIDFGPYGMFIPIFLLGMLTGYFYKYFLSKSYNYIWGLVFIVPFYQLTNVNGMNAVKLMGNLFIYMIVAFLFNRFLAPHLNRYLLR